jgi:transposase
MSSAQWPQRKGAEFFTAPTQSTQRRYEILRAYFAEGAAAADVAARFGVAPSTVATMVRDFRAGDTEFFIERHRGPQSAPAKEAARDHVVRLRRAGHSVTEIAAALADGPTPLNRTGVWEILRQEGFERLVQRAPDERGAPRRDHPPRTRVLEWPATSVRWETDFAGLLLLVPGLVALDLRAAVAAARFPVPARSPRCPRCSRCSPSS